ncbi:molecular chaperone GroES [Petrotoga mexicana DSM 14811]|jgi:chaperonin GroES|uniref:Co-chaperonin GroES n=4 Tax=Petrotoga TaxID=28236 RepID=CH10_PETMO|nr:MULTISPECIES: co-chaperone GroES [Petrotoga]A9BHK3.1 RecName: Full=Co-chaperonin GroES; AltName: Full=10 kDa chaperonin; AltName: Full=Chaperonin-10; Short=Cpn10 [Petrotoga mobilis SJ95]ABX31875.1 chaperonin Cpn10 [Petrotoga mobilis SJ95]PNR90256.1 molecular chaperone GroES [Petrotoga sp. 9T1HF07.CasAA.8.2]PNR93251.1 molecular chaperone GroES [Petrotoga sp. HWHPT.55.6.3]PNR98282.1 molecular chaperone GroES [Petrotoga mexicana DSM 14811]PNR99501.1 molecular chaperone GroES [Petrotoga miothe
MTVKPLGNRLLIKPITEERKTEGGIVLPDSAKEKPQKAEVKEVGKLDEDYDLKVGDKVIFSKYAGTEIKIDDEDYIIIDVEDVLAKVED